MYDIHSHILPGVDDGPGDLKTAMSMIDVAYNQGVRHMVCTSHLNHPLKFHSSGIDKAYDLMKVNVGAKYGDMHLYKGYEVYIGRNKLKTIGQLDLGTMGDSDYILVEFSRDISFEDMDTAVHELRLLKLKVIIAHPEVYDCLRKDIGHMEVLKKDGVLFQCNASSVIKEDESLIRRWIEHNLVDFIGSDVHGIKVRPNYMSEAYDLIKKDFGEEEAKKLFVKNPKAVVQNKAIESTYGPVKKKRVKTGVEFVFGLVAIALLSTIIYGATGSIMSNDEEDVTTAKVEQIEVNEEVEIDKEVKQVEINEDLLTKLRDNVSEIEEKETVDVIVPEIQEEVTIDTELVGQAQTEDENNTETSVPKQNEEVTSPEKETVANEPSHEEFLVGSYVNYMEELRTLYMTIVDDYYIQLKAAVRIEDEEEREVTGKAIKAELSQMEVEVDNEVNKVLYDMQNDLEDYDYDVAVVQELRDSYYDTKSEVSGKYKAELEAYYEQQQTPGP